ATGKPETLASFVIRKVPRSQSATSVEVPPISKVMMSWNPAARAERNAPTIPPAGPERMVRTGSCAAAAAEMLPPDDCMTLKDGLWSLLLGLCLSLDGCVVEG